MATFRRFLSLASASVLAAALLVAPASRAAEPLLLQWGTIDTSSAAAQAESAALNAAVAKKAAAARKAGAAAESRAAYVVQFPGPVADEWRAWLESATQVRGYLPEFAYLVWATASEMETIAANPDVFWTGEWKKEYKTVCAGFASPAKTTASADSSEARWMQVGSLLTGDDGAAALRARLEALPADVRSAFPRLDGSSAVAFLTDAQIDEVASWPDVEWIEPKLKARLFNDQSARTNMMNVSNAWKALSSGGLGLTGTNQIVAVADTGLDMGSTNDIHADFAGRVVAAYGWTNGIYKPSASWADTHSHGTHVCGSILGNGAKSSGLFKGMGHEAKLVFQGMGANLRGIPADTRDMLGQAYDAGARIHSDSWGYGTNCPGVYNFAAVYVDIFTWENQNFLAVIAAGNDGTDADADGVIDRGSVSCPGTSKNCLCVGAAENFRSYGGRAAVEWGARWPERYPADPVKSDTVSSTNAPQGLAAFSSRGPTADGRFKPDIVAPGTDVVSPRSRASTSTGWSVAANTNYLYMGGTSMATPLTSGALALVRQWLVDYRGIDEPPAALMKALLVNGARDMTPGQYGTGPAQEITGRPDFSQGFGHVDLCNSLDPGDGRFLVFATNAIADSYGDYTTNLVVGAANAGTYRITLAWQDYPGTPAAAKTLVNDLDLVVTAPSGTRYYPNGLGTDDRLNNIESVEFAAAETGTWTVRVYGYDIAETDPHGGQPFALVMSGPVTGNPAPAAPAFAVPTFSDRAVPGEAFYFDFEPLLATSGWPEPGFDIVAPAGVECETADSMFAFTPESDGTYTFVCTASNANGSSTCTLTVTAAPIPTAAPDWIPFPKPFITADGDWSCFPSNFATGFPPPEITLESTSPGINPDDFYFEDGEFAIAPSLSGPGTYTFTFLASNTLGTASADLAVTVVADLDPYITWLAGRNLDPATPPSILALNAQTYYWNYIADIDPTSTNLLELSFTSDTDPTLSFTPFSTNRSYQLLYWTNLLSPPVTNLLTPTNLFLPTDATGFGRLRVTVPPSP